MTTQTTRAKRPAPGTRVVFRWRKWNGGEHWVHECVYLGSDQWGDWFGQPLGWRSHRPGRDMVAMSPNVTVIPASGDYALTHNAAPAAYRIYIDLAWDVHWEGEAPTGIDMDLDVVWATDERGLFIDDRDEWDEHRVEYGYPLDIVEHLETLAVDLEARVRAGAAPFDEVTARHWLDRLAAVLPA